MRKADLVIKNGRVVTPYGITQGDLVIHGGKVLSIGTADRVDSEEEFDAGGSLVLPGAIDPHMHFGILSPQDLIQNMETDTGLALSGGVTTGSSTTYVNPKQTLPESLTENIELATGRSYIDFKIVPMPFSGDNMEQIKSCAALGANMFKFLMGYKGADAEMLGCPPSGLTLDLIYQGFSAIAACGAQCKPMIHAEEPYLTDIFRQKVVRENRQNMLVAWNDASPGIAEAIDIYKAAMVAKTVGVNLYVVHVSATESVDLIKHLHSQDHSITAETCLHYLVRNTEDDLGALGKVKPPIRTRVDQERLWRGLREGTITTVGTDTAPGTLEEKKSKSDFWEAPLGLGSNTGLLLPILFSEGVLKGRINIETLVKILCENPARALGIYPTKGVLLPGADADMVILDPSATMVVEESRLQTRRGFSIYEGWKVQGLPVATFLRGELVARGYDVASRKKRGKWLPVLPG